ncbi:leucine zipper protein 2-like [Anguilla anguilla]|uniref:leucine zipper protein 2-like n=1 Tax=Anguilla anguilla TaxID=7936 RepID=UPI0015AACC38|nr:leucine zipper protein 2-like [Anguilla anguilla]
MKLICVVCLLFLFPALSLNKRQSYEGLERKLKEVFTERAGILRQLSKTSNELDNIKGNLKSLKNGERVPKKDVQRILELSQKQRDEMKSLQAALQKQLDEATERAEKQQATVSDQPHFLFHCTHHLGSTPESLTLSPWDQTSMPHLITWDRNHVVYHS